MADTSSSPPAKSRRNRSKFYDLMANGRRVKRGKEKGKEKLRDPEEDLPIGLDDEEVAKELEEFEREARRSAMRRSHGLGDGDELGDEGPPPDNPARKPTNNRRKRRVGRTARLPPPTDDEESEMEDDEALAYRDTIHALLDKHNAEQEEGVEDGGAGARPKRKRAPRKPKVPPPRRRPPPLPMPYYDEDEDGEDEEADMYGGAEAEGEGMPPWGMDAEYGGDGGMMDGEEEGMYGMPSESPEERKKREAEEAAARKEELLVAIKHEEAMGSTFSQKYTSKSSEVEMRAALGAARQQRKIKSTVKLLRQALFTCIRIVENINTRFHPVGEWLDLDGWTGAVMKNMADYDSVIQEIVEFHGGDIPFLSSPYVRLAGMLGFSAFGFVMAKNAEKRKLKQEEEAREMAEIKRRNDARLNRMEATPAYPDTPEEFIRANPALAQQIYKQFAAKHGPPPMPPSTTPAPPPDPKPPRPTAAHRTPKPPPPQPSNPTPVQPLPPPPTPVQIPTLTEEPTPAPKANTYMSRLDEMARKDPVPLGQPPENPWDSNPLNRVVPLDLPKDSTEAYAASNPEELSRYEPEWSALSRAFGETKTRPPPTPPPTPIDGLGLVSAVGPSSIAVPLEGQPSLSERIEDALEKAASEVEVPPPGDGPMEVPLKNRAGKRRRSSARTKVSIQPVENPPPNPEGN
jgi:hypothetical protein